MLGEAFEREIFEQPAVWERVARAREGERLADELDGAVMLLGSGSSLFAAQIGALALRRRGIDAHALAATEARHDHLAYHGRTVVAISQSGRSSDVLTALDALRPRQTIALTNTVPSPLSERANVTIDIGAGRELAIPATKSVTATIAILLAAATRLGTNAPRTPEALIVTARAVNAWLHDEQCRAQLRADAARIAQHRDIVVLGTDYGAPVAREAALKFKEATYMHAEGFEAGEFRHGSAAMLDDSIVVIGVVDPDGRDLVGRQLHDAVAIGALCLTIGSVRVDGIETIGPLVDDAYNTLAWLVTIQSLALGVARERGIDSDRPRRLTKAVITE